MKEMKRHIDKGHINRGCVGVYVGWLHLLNIPSVKVHNIKYLLPFLHLATQIKCNILDILCLI